LELRAYYHQRSRIACDFPADDSTVKCQVSLETILRRTILDGVSAPIVP